MDKNVIHRIILKYFSSYHKPAKLTPGSSIGKKQPGEGPLGRNSEGGRLCAGGRRAWELQAAVPLPGGPSLQLPVACFNISQTAVVCGPLL